MSPPVFRNLIVEDFHPEFVGEKGILVHEITYRSPVRALVPGLLKDETEKKSDDERQTMVNAAARCRWVRSSICIVLVILRSSGEFCRLGALPIRGCRPAAGDHSVISNHLGRHSVHNSAGW